MKKLICFLMAAVLVLGLCACNNIAPDTTDIFAGIWIVMPETSEQFAGSTLILNEDGTATLAMPGKDYTMTWAMHIAPDDAYGADGKLIEKWWGFANNPDAIDFHTVSGPEGDYATDWENEPTFPVLKATLNVVDGEMFLQIIDGNGKDDDFKIELLLKKVVEGTVVEMADPTTPAPTEAATEATVEATVEATEAATEATGETTVPATTTAG